MNRTIKFPRIVDDAIMREIVINQQSGKHLSVTQIVVRRIAQTYGISLEGYKFNQRQSTYSPADAAYFAGLKASELVSLPDEAITPEQEEAIKKWAENEMRKTGKSAEVPCVESASSANLKSIK